MPIVATIAFRRRRPTITPFTIPAAIAQQTAKSTAGRTLALSPAGMWVEMTTASETPPATDRSNPPCWTTSIWPRPTMTRMAAKGRLPASVP